MATAPTNARTPGWQQLLPYLIVIAATFAATWYALSTQNKPDQMLPASDIPQFDPNSATQVNNVPQRQRMNLQWGTNNAIDGIVDDWTKLPSDDYFVAALEPTTVFASETISNKKKETELVKHYYSMNGRMMEDANNLYVSARIGDPKKQLMTNAIPPEVTNSDDARTPGNYLQIRLSFDGGDTEKVETSASRAIELHLWYSELNKRAFLGLFPGLGTEKKTKELHGDKTIAAGDNGFECAFKQIEHNCNIEAKIPWDVLSRRPAENLKAVKCIWQVIRKFETQKDKTFRLVDLVNIADGNTAEILKNISLIDTHPDGTRRWGTLERKGRPVRR